MITVLFNNIVFDKNNHNIIFTRDTAGIKVEGHAGTANKGQDVVCAAISVLAQTAVLAISKIVNIEQELKQTDGLLESVFNVTFTDTQQDIRLKTVLEQFYIGIVEINKHNPGTVKIEFT